MKNFNKEYITTQTHKVMLHQEKNILVGDILQTDWDYFICLPFQLHLWGKSKKEYEFFLRGFRHNLLTKLTTASERKNGARLETFSVLHKPEKNAHFHFAIKVTDSWKKIQKEHSKFYFVRKQVKKVMVNQMKLTTSILWDKKEDEIFKPVNDANGVFAYCVADDGLLNDLIDKTNLEIIKEVA